jgi:hypothetical protein
MPLFLFLGILVQAAECGASFAWDFAAGGVFPIRGSFFDIAVDRE